MKNELGALMLWIDRKLNKNHDALVTKIDAIQNLFETSSEASASAADILEGKTAFNGTTLMTGTMVNQESREATLLAGGTYNIPRGFHDGAGRVLATDLASQTAGTATAGGILQGLKAWVAGRMIDGTMKDRRGVTVAAGAVTQDDEYTYLSIPEEACYNANSKVRTPNSNIFAKSKIAVKSLAAFIPNGSGSATTQATFTLPKACQLLEIEYSVTGGYYYSNELFIDNVSYGEGYPSKTISKTNVPAGTEIRLVAKRNNPDNLQSSVSANASIAYVHRI